MSRNLVGQKYAASQKLTLQENISISPRASVYRVIRNGAVYARKLLKISPEESTLPPNMIKELSLPNELKTQFVIHPSNSDIVFDPEEQTVSFLYEYGAFDLAKLFKFFTLQKKKVSKLTTKSILFQILLGLDFMHSRGIAHCNVTPSHIMLMPTTSVTPGIIRFLNFSLGRVVDSTQPQNSSNLINISYRAPEVIFGATDFDYSVDIWAAGIIFAEFLTGRNIIVQRQDQSQNDAQHLAMMAIIENLGMINYDDFPRHDSYRFYQRIFSQIASTPNMHSQTGLLQKDSSIEPDALDLLLKMLRYNPEERITAKEALRHPYFNATPTPVCNISRTFLPEEWKSLVKVTKD